MGNTDSRLLVAPLMMALFALWVPSAHGEDALAVKVGARARAYLAEGPPGKGATGSKKVTGTLLGLSDTTLTIDDGEQKVPVVVDRHRVTKLELSLRRGRRGRGALIGLGAGVAAAFLVGLASGSDPEPCFVCFTAAEKGGMLSVLLGPVGAGIGAAVAPGERWQTIAPDRIRLGLGGASRPRAAIAFTLRF